ncbi:hypothetical protein GPK34_00800 [Secundilactobacillus kimchicus]|uniref:hypothetical protein n=1 Tax=Secundilactobacillus kimchicus TaxID=528209 RepID=UPI001C00B78C|nr:hypothetical protein [Secundilactobacillus kimchicus]MBT9670577.1 hypothetical protein [Secundilactobacillus kimchicus]
MQNKLSSKMIDQLSPEDVDNYISIMEDWRNNAKTEITHDLKDVLESFLFFCLLCFYLGSLGFTLLGFLSLAGAVAFAYFLFHGVVETYEDVKGIRALKLTLKVLYAKKASDEN